jgi:hypothetical protein
MPDRIPLLCHKVEVVKADIKEIKHACKKIQTLNQEMLLAITAEAETKLSDAVSWLGVSC